MQKQLYYALFLLVLISFPKLYSEHKYEIKFSFAEDDRCWKKAFHEEDKLVSLTEYFLENESKDTWSELVNLQYFTSRYDFPIQTLFDNAIKELAKTFNKSRIDSRCVKATENYFIGEWWIKENSPHDQHEIVKIFKKDNSVGILRYTTRRPERLSSKIRIWQKIITNSSFDLGS